MWIVMGELVYVDEGLTTNLIVEGLIIVPSVGNQPNLELTGFY